MNRSTSALTPHKLDTFCNHPPPAAHRADSSLSSSSLHVSCCLQMHPKVDRQSERSPATAGYQTTADNFGQEIEACHVEACHPFSVLSCATRVWLVSQSPNKGHPSWSTLKTLQNAVRAQMRAGAPRSDLLLPRSDGPTPPATPASSSTSADLARWPRRPPRCTDLPLQHWQELRCGKKE